MLGRHGVFMLRTARPVSRSQTAEHAQQILLYPVLSFYLMESREPYGLGSKFSEPCQVGPGVRIPRVVVSSDSTGISRGDRESWPLT